LISYVDKDGRYRFNNKAYESWLGHKREDIYGKHMSEVLGAAAYKNIQSRVEEVLTGKKVCFENLIPYKDGGERYVMATYVPHFSLDNDVLGFYVEVNDVTEQKHSNQALRESEERFEAAVNAVKGILWTNNATGEMEGEQPGWASLTGQNFEEYQGYGWAKAVHPEDAQPTIDAWNKAVTERKTFEFEHRLLTRDKGWRRFEIKAVPLFNKDGSIREWVGVHTDITEQREAENAIRESEQRFRLMADASPVMIWTLDAAGSSTYYNKKAIDFTGHTEEELKDGKSWQTAIHPDDIQYAGELVGNAVRNKLPYQMECRMKRVDGEWRWLLSHGMPRLNEKGELVGYVGSSVDITERRVAEEALKASEDRYQNFIRQSTEGIWRFELNTPLRVDVPGKQQIDHFFQHAYLAECNDAMAQMYGYQSSAELKNLQLANFFPSDADTEAYFINFIESGYRVQNTESKEVDRSGQTRYFSNNLIGIIENGLLLRAWGTQRDITAQKSAEEKLAKSELYFRQLTDTVPAIIWITRPDGYCTYLNKNWYDYTGQTLGEAEGFGWLDATHPEDAAEAERLFVEAITKQKPYYMLYRLRHKGGSYRWAIDSGQPKFDKDGSFEGMIGTVIDVHEQKLAEDTIRENEQKFRTLAESLPQLVWMTDEKGNLEYASSQWKEYSGVELAGSASWQDMVHPHDIAAVTRAWISSIESGSLYKTEARLKDKGGNYRWHFLHSEPVKDKDGKITKWIGAFTDINDQKTITERLERLVAARTQELQRSNEDLQQFAHVASHDLKEPARKIKIFAGRLEQEDNENLSLIGKTYLHKMQRAADRMFTMIDGVLTYSTLNADAQTIQKVDLAQVITTIEADLELVIKQNAATINQRNLPQIEGAEVLLYQLFYNLINNSLKFSRAGVPATISITAETITKENNKCTQIIVQDNGIGFEPQQAEIIFGTFERLHPKDKYDGTGLGLALCKKIAERHGGVIKAEGGLNTGAKFIILLPLEQKQRSI
jgi:PAS domain S-box-containing protein